MNNSANNWEVVVVGLGAMGAAALYQLARRGVRVLGVDRFQPPHDQGSSHGETRITRLALGEGGHYLPLARRTHEIWRDLEAETEARLFREVGCLVFSSTTGREVAHGAADFLKTTIDVAQTNGIPHEVLDADAMTRRFPQFRFADDEMGCFEPGAGLVHPDACIAAQLDAAKKHGATVRTGERVLRWHEDGSGVSIETDIGSYRADRLVLTAGAWLPSLVPELAVSARVFRQVLFWFETEGPASQFSDEVMPTFIRVPDARAAMFYGFPVIDSTGGLKIAGEQFDVTCQPDAVNREVSDQEVKAMHALASPHLRITQKLLRSAVCKYTVTPDFDFVIDRHPATDKVCFASACSGHGFKHSATVGEALAQLMVDGRSEFDLSHFRLKRAALTGCD